jgi:Sulfotransferase domain
MVQVIGAGFPRTGTSSMKAALEQLGLGPCHHMFEVFAHPEQGERWHAAALAKHDDPGRTVDWDWVLEGYRSAVDWPSGHFWQEIAAAYPDAKIILTTRDPHRWYRSMSETIFAGMGSGDRPSDRLGAIGAMMEIVFGATFGHSDDAPTEDSAVEVYRRHVDHVRATAPADRLLVHEASEGWAPLCAFLGVPVPDTPYPHLNDTRALQDFAATMREGGTASTPFGDITFPADQGG